MENKNRNTDNSFEKNTDKKNTRAKLPTVLLVCIGYVLACAYVPLFVYVDLGTWFTLVSALGMCVLCAAVMSRIAGSAKPVMSYILAVAVFSLFCGMLLPMALISAVVSGTCMYTYLLREKRSASIWGLPVAALVIVTLVTGRMMSALLSLATLPASIILSYSVKNKLSRISAVCRISAGICLSAVLIAAVGIYRYAGELSVRVVLELIDSARAALIAIMDETLTDVGAVLRMDLGVLGIENFAETAVSALFNLLPAMIITVSNICAYVIHSLYLSANFLADRNKSKDALPMFAFDMSLASAIIYVASLVLSLVLTAPSLAIYGTAAQNLLLILAPGLILTALAGIRMLTVRKGPSCFGTLAYMLLVFMLLSFSPIVIMATALGGAILIIVSHIAMARSTQK